MPEPMPQWMSDLLGDDQTKRKPGEKHPQYPWLVRDSSGNWPVGSAPYEEEKNIGVSKIKSTNDPSKPAYLQTEEVDYSKYPDLFKEVPRKDYQGVIDYLDKYYKSNFTKQKLINIFNSLPDFKNLSKEQKEKLSANVLSDALYGETGIHNRKVFVPDMSKYQDIVKIDPFAKQLTTHGAGAYNTGRNIIVENFDKGSGDYGYIPHEQGHHTGYVGEVNQGDDSHYSMFLDQLSDKVIDNLFQLKDTSASHLNSNMGEWKTHLDDLRVFYNLPVDKPITKEMIEKSGMLNHPTFMKLNKYLNIDDIVRAFNTIAYDDSKQMPPDNAEKFRSYIKEVNQNIS